MPSNFEQYLSQTQDLHQRRVPFVTVTIVNSLGSLPQEIGARCLVTSEGLVWGTVGGGKLEAFAIKKATEILQSTSVSKNQFVEVNLQTDIGMSCGGKVSLFFEITKSTDRWKIAIFGAGHVGQELARQLLRLDCDITVIDSRQEWLSKLPTEVQQVHQQEMLQELVNLPKNSFIVSVTMGHSTDLPILKKALTMNFPYVGCMGSETKATKIRKELKEAKLTDSQIEKLICPIGENFGNNTPPEIGISIIAQLLKSRDRSSVTKF